MMVFNTFYSPTLTKNLFQYLKDYLIMKLTLE
jgi:hypothetical protein